MPGENRIVDLRYHGIIVSDNPWQNTLVTFQAMDKVLAHLLANRQDRNAAFFELTQCFRLAHVNQSPFRRVLYKVLAY